MNPKTSDFHANVPMTFPNKQTPTLNPKVLTKLDALISKALIPALRDYM
jgi:hypothetical protein